MLKYATSMGIDRNEMVVYVCGVFQPPFVNVAKITHWKRQVYLQLQSKENQKTALYTCSKTAGTQLVLIKSTKEHYSSISQ